ncbi:hypothetical protein FRC03_007412 [Tulasnella sp. 419]|nr:hypothetical protein FRC03_007412 [Tulasnella sp. 419]
MRSSAITGRLDQSATSTTIKAYRPRDYRQKSTTGSVGSSSNSTDRKPSKRSASGEIRSLGQAEQEVLRQEGVAKRLKAIQELSVAARHALQDLSVDSEAAASAQEWTEVPHDTSLPGGDDDELEDEVTEYTVARAEATYNIIVDATRGAYYITTTPRVPRQNRATRLALLRESWDFQIEGLANTYLRWKHREQVTQLPDVTSGFYWEILLVSLGVYLPHQRMPSVPSGDPVQQLAELGFLSSTPLKPSVAFSFDTLETFRLLSNRCPRLSRQAFVKAICDTHSRIYSPTLRQQFSDTYDTYLAIRRHVEKRVNMALGRDSPDWRIQHP